jgi:uncharacterized protein YukE
MSENHQLQVFVTNTVTKIKSRIVAFFASHDSDIDRLKQQVSDRATALDRELTERYPERYKALNQKAGEAKSWYDQQIAEQKANPDRPLPLEQNDLRLTKRMEEIGQTVAQTERTVRSKIAAKFQSEPPKS